MALYGITIEKIEVQEGDTKIIYQYRCDRRIQQYFNPGDSFFVKYDEINLSAIPESILIIPLLAQVLPISWFAGFDIVVNEVDETFFHAAEIIRRNMLSQHGLTHYSEGSLKYDKLVINDIEKQNRSLLLYSGGVDSITSLINHSDEHPDIVTIQGADVDINDNNQWNLIKTINEQSEILHDVRKFYVRSNLRSFHTFRVPLLLKDRAWWGKVQHGLGLTGLLAPITFSEHYSKVYIASTYSRDADFAWGSLPRIDNEIKWNGTQVVHDASDIKRIDKIRLIKKYAEVNGQKIPLRVCFSSKNQGINCNQCEKCYRTILALMIIGTDPNSFGFQVTPDIYREINDFVSKGFYTKGEAYFWDELGDSIKEADSIFYFSDPVKERSQLIAISSLIETKVSEGIHSPSRFTLFRQRVQLMFPNLTRWLIAFRNRLRSER